MVIYAGDEKFVIYTPKFASIKIGSSDKAT